MTPSEEATFDPRRRRLCPDGSCVGLIGDNNRCKVCGLSADGSADPTAAVPDTLAATWDGTQAAADDDATLPRTLGDVAQFDEPAAFSPDRRLCSDGTCVGVIGADGRCKVCGRPGE